MYYLYSIIEHYFKMNYSLLHVFINLDNFEIMNFRLFIIINNY